MLKRGEIVESGSKSRSIGLSINSVAASSSGDLGSTQQKTPSVKIATLAHLRSIYLGLTLIQRQQLRVIVKAESHPLNTTVTLDLIALGLVHRDGDVPTATEDGRYVASLY